MSQTNKAVIVKEYQLEFGKIFIYDNYMLSSFKEGTTITLEKAFQIMSIGGIHFKNKDFGYISLRKNTYAIDPTVYNYAREFDNLKAFAIISVKEIDMHNFKIEKMFYKKPMKFFIEYSNGLAWVKSRLAATAKTKE